MTDRLTPNRYGQPAPAGGHHHPYRPQEVPTMTNQPTPAQRIANGYAKHKPATAQHAQASRAALHLEGQAEELTKAADQLLGNSLLRMSAGYAQGYKDIAREVGQE